MGAFPWSGWDWPLLLATSQYTSTKSFACSDPIQGVIFIASKNLRLSETKKIYAKRSWHYRFQKWYLRVAFTDGKHPKLLLNMQSINKQESHKFLQFNFFFPIAFLRNTNGLLFSLSQIFTIFDAEKISKKAAKH